jgi:BirA family biotin operon repressor/biotin-[acetyl-CoA-carboxylase] ligase
LSARAGLPQRVYACLADGGAHSGEQLARLLGVTRSAVWKAVAQLQLLGMDIEAAPRRGYRLRMPARPLDAAAIDGFLAAPARSTIRHLDVAWSLPSTNTKLMAVTDLPPGRCDVLLTEHQSSGRGRRSRSWLAPPGGAICLSIGWCFNALPADAGALSLAVGVAALRVLATLGDWPLALKWPNDLVVAGRKLGGILIELRAEAAGPAYVVIGIGINVNLGKALSSTLRASGAAPVDLQTLGLTDCDRNRVVAALIDELLRALPEFERSGFSSFSGEWAAADALRDQPVSVSSSSGDAAGVACGIDAQGALCVRTAAGLRHFHAGEVSVRPTP